MNFKKGDFVSRISYFQVVDIAGDDLVVQNEQGFKWQLNKQILENEIINSAESFSSTKKVHKTELARIFVEETGDRVFSVNFTKKDGAERELVGRRRDFNGYLGMSNVIDLKLKKDTSKNYDTRNRIVTHDSINWLILNDIKYILKK